jgi:hypothetical protein
MPTRTEVVKTWFTALKDQQLLKLNVSLVQFASCIDTAFLRWATLSDDITFFYEGSHWFSLDMYRPEHARIALYVSNGVKAVLTGKKKLLLIFADFSVANFSFAATGNGRRWHDGQGRALDLAPEDHRKGHERRALEWFELGRRGKMHRQVFQDDRQVRALCVWHRCSPPNEPSALSGRRRDSALQVQRKKLRRSQGVHS